MRSRRAARLPPFPMPYPLPSRPSFTDKAYATALIGGASNVADALLGPQDQIFGTASQFASIFTPLARRYRVLQPRRSIFAFRAICSLA